MPEGETSVTAEGGAVKTEKGMRELHGPYPELFHVWMRQVYEPLVKTAGDNTEQVPVPAAQFAAAAVNH